MGLNNSDEAMWEEALPRSPSSCGSVDALNEPTPTEVSTCTNKSKHLLADLAPALLWWFPNGLINRSHRLLGKMSTDQLAWMPEDASCLGG